MLFQTQQKMKKGKKGEKSGDKHKHKKRTRQDKGEDSKTSSPSSSAAGSIRTSAFVNENINDSMDIQEVSENLADLKRTDSTGSLSSNIAAKYSFSAESTGTNSPTKTVDELPVSKQLESISPHLLDVNDRRRNSASTNTSIHRLKYRRNSSLSSSQTSSSNSAKDKGKLNTHASTQNSASESIVESDRSSKIFKPSYSMAQNDQLPEFNTLRDLSIMNSISRMNDHLLTPSFQFFRYNNFLDILTAQHNNDPINFAYIRLNSIAKFIARHGKFTEVSTEEVLQSNDVREFEGLLAYNLIKLRTFLRNLIKIHSTKDSSRTEIFSCEELVQVNFTNYIRYILNLPQKVLTTPSEQLDEIQAMHQQFKILFFQMSKALHHFKKEDSGDDVTNTTNSFAFLLQIITKVSYDFILLEKYHINILTKLSNNSLIDSRLVQKLYKIYVDSMGGKENKVLPKVLVYNSFFSAQYSWYMAVTIPFLRVIEMNVFNEDARYIGNLEAYRSAEQNSTKTSFEKLDEALFKHYYSKFSFESYSQFRNTSDEQFVTIQRSLDDNNSISSDSSNSSSAHKPPNFSFYAEPLTTIPCNTFDVIHSRDLLFQLTNTNYKTILSEFHRVLKTGGILEVPIILLGTETIKGGQVVGLPRFTNTSGLNLGQYYDMIPNFAEVLFSTIIEIFGEGNVKFSVVLLNSSNEITDFLANDIGLHIAEMLGKTDDFCRNFEKRFNEERRDTHFFFLIHAEKE